MIIHIIVNDGVTSMKRCFDLLPVYRLKIKWLLHKGSKLSKWERKFLKSMYRHKNQLVTVKQMDKIDEIYHLVRDGKFRYIGQEHYNYDYGIGEYAYLHDFN